MTSFDRSSYIQNCSSYRRTLEIVGIFLLAIFSSNAADAQSYCGENTPDNRAFASELQGYAQLLALPGASVAVVRDGQVIFRLNLGYTDIERKVPMGNDAIFSIASVTKSFTGVMMMQFEHEKKLSLNDYLLKYPVDWTEFSAGAINANVRLKHVLSMTSEDIPGKTFAYNGGRFNLLQGVFDHITGHSAPASYAEEVSSRILGPLKMKSTFDGYPKSPTALTSHVVHRYRLSSDKNGISYSDVPYDSQAAYPAPAAGLFSTVEDLAAYSTALDNNTLISGAQYDEMTTPCDPEGGRTIPYGYGWLTQQFQGIKLHWVYGEGDLDSALLLRVPEQRLTFIFLSNSGSPSHAACLYNGDVLRSPFAIAFLRHFVIPHTPGAPHVDYGAGAAEVRKAFTSLSDERGALDYEELFTQALMRSYMRQNLNVGGNEPEDFIRLLYDVHPQAFDCGDIPMIYLMAGLNVANLHEAADRLIGSFDVKSDFRPVGLYFLGRYFDKNGDYASAAKYFRLLTDRPGFINEGAKIDATLRLGRYYLKEGKISQGRDYIWNSAVWAQESHYNDSYMTDMVAELSRD